MKKKGILLIAVILLSTAGLAQAQEGELSGTVDVTYLSSYIWRGFDWYPERHSAIQSSVDLDLYGTGFGVSVFMSRATGGGFENTEWWNYTLYYKNSAFEYETYVTNYKIGWGYYNFPDMSRKVADLLEFVATLSWPDICPVGFVPSYTIVAMWPSGGKQAMHRDFSGWYHVLGLGYDLTVEGFTPDIPEQTLHLSVSAWYNDGLGGDTVDHDWSHAVFGVSTNFDLGSDVTLTPGIYHQASMDDSVNDSDETWVSLSVSHAF